MFNKNNKLSVEKIGGTSMSQYKAVRDNIMLFPENPYNRVFVVSAYSGVTDDLLEHKKTGKPGVYGLFANDDTDANWKIALEELGQKLNHINANIFSDSDMALEANRFINKRIAETEQLLSYLQSLCRHGHFSLESHLLTVRELLASIGEAHSAWNLTHLLQHEGIKTQFIDLTGWQTKNPLSLDEMITSHFSEIDFSKTLPIVTGYTHCSENLMQTYDRGYSEMTFSRIAVKLKAVEAVIHKEYHLSSADPRLVGEKRVIPIGKTNYDIADQLANLGMEAIHPSAAQGLRQLQIPLRIKNTFEPNHHGTLITQDYKSDAPKVEIIAGMQRLLAVEIFDQDMMGNQFFYEQKLLEISSRLKCKVINKDFNANTITMFVDASLKKVNRLTKQLQEKLPNASIQNSTVSLVSAMGSDMRIKGFLNNAVSTLYENGINIEAIHQNTRQVEMQFFVNEADYEKSIKALHQSLIEVHNHGNAICAH
ncbi:aspartate kinase [Thiomicrorhabdus lithotrophica]|uniref:aspartate kinase n=1 Tax=Thiomicrorhabdus lithotrophica TaxID=2949997 RepID=A0ABY8CAP6_9GAMM|nr:aspartate kinase [Thiomicrorhabdus lithotrophica]WEJ63051.1 aspartate kinase [Thiomicrorhabdus lithotrophica]